jgi:hypothetical protein
MQFQKLHRLEGSVNAPPCCADMIVLGAGKGNAALAGRCELPPIPHSASERLGANFGLAKKFTFADCYAQVEPQPILAQIRIGMTI